MAYSITCSTRILIFTIAPFLFMFVGIIFEFAVVPGVYILYCPLRKKRFSFLSDGTNIRIQHHIHQKDLNLCYIMLLCQSCCWIGKNTNKKFSCVIVLIVRPSSTLKFQFVFGFNECLRDLFLIKFWKFLVLYLDCGCIFMIWFYGTNDFKPPLKPHADE